MKRRWHEAIDLCDCWTKFRGSLRSSIELAKASKKFFSLLRVVLEQEWVGEKVVELTASPSNTEYRSPSTDLHSRRIAGVLIQVI